MNQTLELINNRRSLRAFSDEKIPEDVLRTLKEATLRAPTAGNQMFYSIIEMTDPEKKKQLAVLCDNQAMIATAPIVWVFLADSLKWENFYKESGSVRKGEEQGIQAREIGLGEMHLCMQDAIIAAQNAVIAAESLGLGSCYIGDVIENHEKMVSLLNLKPHAMVAAMLIMGYPKTRNREGKQTCRCPVDSVFMTDGYREPHLPELSYAYAKQEEALRQARSLPFDNTGNIADRYYFRKHMSPFMTEMNRSAKLMVQAWETNREPDGKN